jgi:hypothetical protein
MAAKASNVWSLFMRYQAQAERHYRRAIEDFDRLKSLRPELPNEPIFDPQPEPTEPTCPISETNPIPPENPVPAPDPPVAPVVRRHRNGGPQSGHRHPASAPQPRPRPLATGPQSGHRPPVWPLAPASVIRPSAPAPSPATGIRPSAPATGTRFCHPPLSPGPQSGHRPPAPRPPAPH